VSRTESESSDLPAGLANLPGNGRLILAFSGGADSTALASFVAAGRQGREAVCVHIDHGLDPGSGQRAEAARSIAADLSLAFVLETAVISSPGNQEAAARHARYCLLKKHVEEGDCLLTAHHADDQVETIFLRLMRGAGPRGLAGIPRLRRFGRGWLARPLLDWTRAALQDHCRRTGLAWAEDPSNHSLDADRNFLRHQILPALRQRWAGLDQSVLTSGRLADQAARTIEARVKPLMASALQGCDRIDASRLQGLSDLELAEVIRMWARDRVGDAPPGKPLDEFLAQIGSARRDQIPELRWKTARIRYWHKHFWLNSPEPFVPYALDWRTDHVLKLPNRLGSLQIAGAARAPSLKLRVRSGKAGERLKTASNGSSYRVKELLRTNAIAPWQREQWPRICQDDRLLAVGDRWIDHAFADWLKNHQLELHWHTLN